MTNTCTSCHAPLPYPLVETFAVCGRCRELAGLKLDPTRWCRWCGKPLARYELTAHDYCGLTE